MPYSLCDCCNHADRDNAEARQPDHEFWCRGPQSCAASGRGQRVPAAIRGPCICVPLCFCGSVALWSRVPSRPSLRPPRLCVHSMLYLPSSIFSDCGVSRHVSVASPRCSGLFAKRTHFTFIASLAITVLSTAFRTADTQKRTQAPRITRHASANLYLHLTPSPGICIFPPCRSPLL